MSILQGLKDPSITRLKATRHTLQTVEYRALESWIQFEERLCSDTRYTVLRESIVSQIATHQNVIPWIKLLNKDVNEIERLYSDYVLFEDNVYWNYEKMTLFSTPKIILVKCQHLIQLYNIDDKSQNDNMTQQMLNNLHFLSEQELIKNSQACEPM